MRNSTFVKRREPFRLLPARWTPLVPLEKQVRMWHDPARFIVNPAGRRSGKTERAKRRLVARAVTFHDSPDGRFAAFAPTRDQAKQIYWNDLKLLSPRWAVRFISESTLTIGYHTGATLQVIGMDRPVRAEGGWFDGVVLDEFADMKVEAWTQSIRPTLSQRGRRPGWAWFIGKPRGRNHYWKLYELAKTRRNWSVYTWPSSDVIAPEEVASAREDLDPVTFAQEYEASFVNFAGRAYYVFQEAIHCQEGLRERFYDRDAPLEVAFDFNTEPGVCAVGQEIRHPDPRIGEATAWFGEVWVRSDSRTPIVCERFLKAWKDHRGLVCLYGDATGGGSHTSSLSGNDWELIDKSLRPVFGRRLRLRVPRANPPERSRVNTLNTHLLSASGKIGTLVDPKACPHLVEDLNGTCLLDDGSGEIDKDRKKYKYMTHLSDAIGYHACERHPLHSNKVAVGELL